MALAHAASAEKIHVPSLVLMPPDAKTSALVKTSTFETVHLILRAGATIPPHSVAGYITLYCLEGGVTLEASTTVQLTARDWIYLDPGEQYAVNANEDSSLLLTILFDNH